VDFREILGISSVTRELLIKFQNVKVTGLAHLLLIDMDFAWRRYAL